MIPTRGKPIQTFKWADPPKEIEMIDFSGLLFAVRDSFAGIDNRTPRRFKTEVADVWIVADFRMSSTVRLYTSRWGVAGVVRAERFYVTSFKGDVELCLQQVPLFRVMI